MYKFKKISFLLLLFIGLSSTLSYAQAQNVTVTGKLKDNFDEELIGATVVQKGTTNGTITDIDGNYKITVPANATLEFSYIGLETLAVKVNGKTVIDAQLKQSSEFQLDEVVAIGYGTVKRSELTSAVSSVKGDDIANIPVTDALQALNGKVAGLQITQAQGSQIGRASCRERV